MSTTAKDRAWFAAVASLELCARCGTFGVQVAHRNEGKSFGKKVAAHLTCALCPPCHVQIDSGQHMTRVERRAAMDAAIVATFDQLVRRGIVGLL